MDDGYIILSNSVPYQESTRYTETPYKLVKLMPLGLVHSTKGDFLVDDESFQSILNTFHERGLQIPIDYEHQTLQNVQAPAAGWIKDFVLKSDGIYGAVDWTARATEFLTNREYCYLSPVIQTRKSDHKVIGLHSAALTNTPAIDGMTPIANSNKPGATEPPQGDDANGGGNDPQRKPEGGDASLETLRDLLQLDSSATMEDICLAVAALLENQGNLQLKADAAQFEVTKMKAEGAVTEALKTGKLMPFQKDQAFQTAMKDLPAFTHWLKSAPQVVPMREIQYEHLGQQHPVSRAHELMGLSAEDVAKYGKR